MNLPNLPNEILNLIFSYVERPLTNQIMKDAIEKYGFNPDYGNYIFDNSLSGHKEYYDLECFFGKSINTQRVTFYLRKDIIDSIEMVNGDSPSSIKNEFNEKNQGILRKRLGKSPRLIENRELISTYDELVWIEYGIYYGI